MGSRATTTPLRAAIYTRISNDPEGREKGVENQEEVCRALAEREGHEVVSVYTDNDISASDRSKKRRPAYEEMLAAVDAGQIDIILAYSNSRLSRRPREWLDLIRRAESGRLEIGTVASGKYDLTTADGRAVALTVAAWDAAEAGRTSERVTLAKRKAIAEGRYRGGKRPYGYEADGVTVREDEAAVIRDATAAILAGRSVRALVDELNKADRHAMRLVVQKDEKGRPVRDADDKIVRDPVKVPWTHTGLRDVLLRARNAGKLSTGQITHGNFTIVGDAVWPAIVPYDTWKALFDVLTEPSRRTNDTDHDTTHLGSGLFVCGAYRTKIVEDADGNPLRNEKTRRYVRTPVLDAEGKPVKCGARMRVGALGQTASRPNHKRQTFYRCSASAHLNAVQIPTEEHVLNELVKLVRDPRIVGQLQPAAVDLSAEREERSVLTQRLETFERDYALGHINGGQLAKSTALIEAQIADVDDRLAKAIRRNTSSPIFGAADPGVALMAAPVDVQRSVLATLMRVEIVPAVRSGVSWSKDRVRLYPLVPLTAASADAA
jgi:DNA invertase Pin-like site-specific DNA recombinase